MLPCVRACVCACVSSRRRRHARCCQVFVPLPPPPPAIPPTPPCLYRRYEQTFDHLNVLILESAVPLVLLVLAIAVMSGQKVFRHQQGRMTQQQIWG